VGRPSLKTEGRIKKILYALSIGATKEAAAAAGGISYQTLARWVDADESLAERVVIAEGEAEMSATERIHQEVTRDKGSWQAAAWWLERRRQPHYALGGAGGQANQQRIPIEVAEAIRALVGTNAPALPPPEDLEPIEGVFKEIGEPRPEPAKLKPAVSPDDVLRMVAPGTPGQAPEP